MDYSTTFDEAVNLRMELYATQKELSVLINLSPKRIREIRQAEGIFIPDNKTRKYNLPVCIREYIQYRIQSEASGGSADYEIERAEHERAKKEITRLKLRRLRRESHDAADVEAVIFDMLVRFRSKLLSMPMKLAPMLIGLDVNEIVKIIKLEVNETLCELSEYNPDDYGTDVMEDEEEDSEPDQEDMQ